MTTTLTWLGIVLCLSQSALFSGMNLGLFSVSKLELEVEAKLGDRQAQRVLGLRADANFALVSILWGNVAVNVLLALLSGSVLTGVSAFLFSTVVITLFAEILPQAWFTRHAVTLASTLAPWLRLWQLILYPVARPTAWVLDAWLGPESIRYFREKDLRQVIRLHMASEDNDIARVEGQGALNFLDIDDVPLYAEGEPLDQNSILTLPFDGGQPRFPRIGTTTDDPFLQAVARSGKRWVVLVDPEAQPRLVLRSDSFVREALFEPDVFRASRHCHRPIIVHDQDARLGELIPRYQVRAEHAEDDIIDDDVILLWGEQPQIVTGTDILGRLLRGIVSRRPASG